MSSFGEQFVAEYQLWIQLIRFFEDPDKIALANVLAFKGRG